MVQTMLSLIFLVALPGQAEQKRPDIARERAFAAFLTSGGRTYVKMRDAYIAAFGYTPKWSRDSRTLLLEIYNYPINVRERRRALQQSGDTGSSERALLRYNVETGQRDVFYRIPEGETIEEIIFVGGGADVLFSVFHLNEAGTLVRNLYFAPAIGAIQRINTPPDIRIPAAIASSPTQPLAMLALTTQDRHLQVLLIGPNFRQMIEVPGDWQSGQFTAGSKPESARLLVHSVDEKEKARSSVFDIDYATGTVIEQTPENLKQDLEREVPKKSLLPFRSELYRTARVAREPLMEGDPGSPVLGSPALDLLRDLDLLDDDPKPHRLAMARGIDGEVERSPDGLKFAYRTEQGIFVGELVALIAKPAQKKTASGAP